MIIRTEYGQLNKIAKEIVEKRILKKLEKICDKKERLEMLKYTLKSTIDLKYIEILRKIKKLEKQKKDIFFIEVKSELLASKIRIFNATFNKKDFYNVLTMFNDIEKEMNDVWV
ncbi:MAG: hypothetical protein WC867_07120 [Candidatus Pacearchaeota archaeon]|jgi:hypothetical protein